MQTIASGQPESMEDQEELHQLQHVIPLKSGEINTFTSLESKKVRTPLGVSQVSIQTDEVFFVTPQIQVFAALLVAEYDEVANT